MIVKKIVANLSVDSTGRARAFYQEILGLDLLMDLGWISTFGNEQSMPLQISIAEEGGSGTPVPNISVEVDDIDGVLERIKANQIEIEYGPVTEPWGVIRFYVRDPCGNLINILQHV
jgi:catechol 2,3-dioxygenase-like lactoylglutathione lyase family enzyme